MAMHKILAARSSIVVTPRAFTKVWEATMRRFDLQFLSNSVTSLSCECEPVVHPWCFGL